MISATIEQSHISNESYQLIKTFYSLPPYSIKKFIATPYICTASLDACMHARTNNTTITFSIVKLDFWISYKKPVKVPLALVHYRFYSTQLCLMVCILASQLLPCAIFSVLYLLW